MIPEWGVQLGVVLLLVVVLAWRASRKLRWCNTCRHYSRSDWPQECIDCEDCDGWEAITNKEAGDAEG